MNLASRIMALFEGYSEAHGTYNADDAKTSEYKGGKLEIKRTAKTVREKVTIDYWNLHLKGIRPIGIIPVRDNNTCVWGCIDIDIYDLEYENIVSIVRQEKLPLVPCRTKSGGIHLFLFMQEAVQAEIMQVRLREMAALLGFGTAEIFPKQRAVAIDRGDLGSWLNMPYFNQDKTDRYALKPGGLSMSLDEFVNRAESLRQPRIFLDQSFRKSRNSQAEKAGRKDPHFGDGPPCMQHLTAVGFPEGTRNKGLFNLCTFAKKKYGNRWQETIEEWNRLYFFPPLPSQEVLDVIKSQERKDFNYQCKETPISSHCNSALCRTRKFGVGGEDDYPTVSGLSVLNTQPPLWFLDVGDKRLELTTEQLQNYNLFHRVCMEQLHICYRMMKSNDWLTIVSTAMREAVEIEAPHEVSVHGQFEELLSEFLTDRHRGDHKDDLLNARPWEDTEANRHYFRIRDLMKYLELHSFKSMTRGAVSTRIRKLGGDNNFFNIKGRGVNVFWVPGVYGKVDPLDIPKIDKEVV